MRHSYTDNRGGKILWAKFALPLLLAAMVAAAFLAAPTQAQEATADCGGAGNPLHGRTQKVVDAILGKLGETDCSAVTSTQLADITGTLELNNQGLTSLQEGDFAGLSNIVEIRLLNNSLTALPEDVFDGLSSLTALHAYNNSLTTLPEDVFDGLDNLITLSLYNNSLAWLPPDVFHGLSSLRDLLMYENSSLACIHANQFNGLSSLVALRLHDTKLGNISPDHFGRWSLNNLERLRLGDDLISETGIAFQQYKSVLPALDEDTTRVRSGDGLSSPICGSIEADTDGSGFHTAVRVRLDQTSVYPNRVRTSGTSGDGHCGSDTSAEQHELWTWQSSADGVTWADLASGQQPNGYGVRAAGECSYLYIPQAGDNTMYVRAYVPVTTTGLGNNDYHSAAFGPLNVR